MSTPDRDHYGKELDQVLRKETSGGDRKRVESLLRGESAGKAPAAAAAPAAPRDPKVAAEEDAAKIKEAVDGLGTDEHAIRAVLQGRSKEEIGRLAQTYREKYGHDLRGRLDDELDGREQVELVEQAFDLGTARPLQLVAHPGGPRRLQPPATRQRLPPQVALAAARPGQPADPVEPPEKNHHLQCLYLDRFAAAAPLDQPRACTSGRWRVSRPLGAGQYGQVRTSRTGSTVELPTGTTILRVLQDAQGRVTRFTALVKREPGFFPPADLSSRSTIRTVRSRWPQTAAPRKGRWRPDALPPRALDRWIRGAVLRIPPLRERSSEIEPLARFFLERAARQAGSHTTPSLSREAETALAAHDWPGNIRELRNVIERAVLRCQGDEVTVAHLPLAPAPPSDLRAHVPQRRPLHVILGGRTAAAQEQGPPEHAPPGERDKILRALDV